jgi:hypothetical protein
MMGHLIVRSIAMSGDKPWSPTLENPDDFMDHKNPALGHNSPLRMPLPDEDTAPLRGSKDLSDPDSLEDVIAASYDSDAAPSTSAEPDRAKVPSGIHSKK